MLMLVHRSFSTGFTSTNPVPSDCHGARHALSNSLVQSMVCAVCTKKGEARRAGACKDLKQTHPSEHAYTIHSKSLLAAKRSKATLESKRQASQPSVIPNRHPC